MQAMEEENRLEREMWLQDHHQEQDDLLGVVNDDACMFYADFPPLPDFPCMSSSSSSSSTPALPLNTLTCSTTTSSASSSAASWVVLKSDADDNNNIQAAAAPLATLSSTASMEILPQPENGLNDATAAAIADCTDAIMEPLPYMDILEINDFLDPALVFENVDYPLEEYALQDQNQTQQQQQEHAIVAQQQAEDRDELVSNTNNNNNDEEEEEEERVGVEEGERGGGDGEISDVFLEWLKTNKDSVSANDLRSVKLKKATIESAAKRLGGGKEAMKQLLKLILEWVQTSHLQNKRRNSIINDHNDYNDNTSVPSNFLTNPTPNSNPNSFGPWISPPPPPPYRTDPDTIVAVPRPFPVVGYPGQLYSNGAPNSISPYQQGVTEYSMLGSAHSWPPSHQFTMASPYSQSFGDNNLHRPQVSSASVGFGGYGNQYPYQYFHGTATTAGDKIMRLGPSATREARKKRMARQRRCLSHHRSHTHHGQVQNQTSDHDPLARLGSDHNCTGGAVNPANWVYWASLPGGAASMGPVIPAEPQPGQGQPGLDRTAMQTQNFHQGSKVSPMDQRRQGWKPEKNLRFLLQKVLKQSDVGSLGRIVLPKKEAETHLPELEARDGISIAMEDIGTSRVWHMRYRYWPNNKSRMYLLENTGDFVKANGLQEGDFIVLYSDVKCGKFMIRGVKVRQGVGTKTESKKAGKTQKNQPTAVAVAAAVNDHSPSPSSLPNANPQPLKKMRK